MISEEKKKTMKAVFLKLRIKYYYIAPKAFDAKIKDPDRVLHKR